MWMVSEAAAGLRWFNTATNRITYESGGTNYLAGSKTDSNIGCFLQLIYAGTNGQINLARGTGDGTTVDDEVTATLWFGKDVIGSDVNGWVNNGIAVPGITNGWYYARAWSAPSPNFAAGLIPIAPSNSYGNSALWQYPGTPVPPGPDDAFNFGGAGFSTTLIPDVDSNTNGIPDWWEFLYFNTITGAVASVDTDVDGINNLGEYLSGTVPTDPLSVLSVDNIYPIGGANIVVQWSSVSGKVYSVERGTSATNTFSTLASNITAATVNSYTDAVGGVQFYLYRVRLQP